MMDLTKTSSLLLQFCVMCGVVSKEEFMNCSPDGLTKLESVAEKFMQRVFFNVNGIFTAQQTDAKNFRRNTQTMMGRLLQHLRANASLQRDLQKKLLRLTILTNASVAGNSAAFEELLRWLIAIDQRSASNRSLREMILMLQQNVTPEFLQEMSASTCALWPGAVNPAMLVQARLLGGMDPSEDEGTPLLERHGSGRSQTSILALVNIPSLTGSANPDSARPRGQAEKSRCAQCGGCLSKFFGAICHCITSVPTFGQCVKARIGWTGIFFIAGLLLIVLWAALVFGLFIPDECANINTYRNSGAGEIPPLDCGLAFESNGLVSRTHGKIFWNHYDPDTGEVSTSQRAVAAAVSLLGAAVGSFIASGTSLVRNMRSRKYLPLGGDGGEPDDGLFDTVRLEDSSGSNLDLNESTA